MTAALAASLALLRLGGLAERAWSEHEAGIPAEIPSAAPVVEADPPPSPLDALLPVPAVEPAAGPAPGGGEPLADVVAELARRGEELDRREREVLLREAAVGAVETRVGHQLERLEALKKELEALALQIRAEDEAELAHLVKMYEAMKARSAAQVFDQLGLDILLPIVRRMREAKLAAIVAAMDPAKAKQVTAALGRPTALPGAP